MNWADPLEGAFDESAVVIRVSVAGFAEAPPPRTEPSYVPSMTTVPGYGITVTYDDTALTIEGSNKAARMALADPRSIPDRATLDAPVVIPLDQVAGVAWKPGNMLTNGRMTVTTTDGRVVKLNFRGKQQTAAADLAGALGANI